MKNPAELLTQPWQELPRGGHVLDAGCAEMYETGTWATFAPELKLDICIQCLQCWVMCPDSAVVVKDDKVTGFDLFHCKGCGICEETCPTKPKSIVMVKKDL